VQRWGGPIEEIQLGNAALIQPGEKHWPSASSTTAMTHIIGDIKYYTPWFKGV